MDNQFTAFVLDRLDARAMMGLQDVYKMLYQAQMGIGHLLQEQEDVMAYLEREIAQMIPEGPPDLLWEPVRKDGAVGRVNLRPFVAAGLWPGALADAMITFSLSPPGNEEGLRADWEAVGQMVETKSLPFAMADYLALTRRLDREGYPALHHSQPYRHAYAPAYRILSRPLFLAIPRRD